jgi:hypothetical protein
MRVLVTLCFRALCDHVDPHSNSKRFSFLIAIQACSSSYKERERESFLVVGTGLLVGLRDFMGLLLVRALDLARAKFGITVNTTI